MANPVILSSDQSNTTAFKLFNGKVTFKLKFRLDLNQRKGIMGKLMRRHVWITIVSSFPQINVI